MSDTKKTVVVVGAGPAGATIVGSLSKALNPAKHNLILINPRPYAVILPATLRVVTSKNDELKEKILVPLDKVFTNGNGKLVHGEVVAVHAKEKQVELINGEKIAYDMLVLSTGNTWEAPIGFPNEPKEVDAYIDQRRKEFEAAKDILLVGGGAVGIELAGELRDIYADKNITIVHRNRLLLNDIYPDKLRISIQKQLESRKITVVLDQTLPETIVAGPNTTEVFIKDGKTLHPDLVVRTWGGRPNTDVVKSSLGENSLSGTGHVKVKPTLQLLEHPNIFAAGDIIEWAEQKTLAKASYNHAPVVVKNVLSLVNDSSASVEYAGAKEMIVVTNGKNPVLFIWEG